MVPKMAALGPSRRGLSENVYRLSVVVILFVFVVKRGNQEMVPGSVLPHAAYTAIGRLHAFVHTSTRRTAHKRHTPLGTC